MPRWLARHWSWLFWIIFAAILSAFVYAADQFLPPQHLPWKKLDPERALGMATKSQLLRLQFSPSKTCMTMARDIVGFESIPADAKRPSGECGWDIARVVYSRDEAKLVGEANMQCPLAVGTFLWMRELETLSQRHYQSSLKKLHHFGTYSCRRVRGNSSGRWSEHAYANAWDIAAFELSDGTLISVRSDWEGDKTKRKYLRDARDAACKIFKVTLGPDYNAAHYDHFHVDMGPGSSCR